MIQSGDMQAVQRLIGRLGREIKGIVKSALEISWFSRGGWSYETVIQMSQAEREMAVDFINERLKLAAKSQHPIY
jgi:hypothetical protein